MPYHSTILRHILMWALWFLKIIFLHGENQHKNSNIFLIFHLSLVKFQLWVTL